MWFKAFVLVALVGHISGQIDDTLPRLASPILLEKPSSEIMITLKDSLKPILRDISAQSFASRGAKITAMVSALKTATGLSQAPVIAALRPFKVEFEPFWISNKIYIKNGNPVLVKFLQALPQIKEIAEPKLPGLPPFNPIEGVPPNGTEWNVNIIQAPGVWELGSDGQGVVVCVDSTRPQIMEPQTTVNRQARKALDFTVVRGGKLQTKTKCYKDIYYTNSLRVNRDIQLTGFTFLTPPKEKMDKTVYTVLIKKIRKPEVVQKFKVLKTKAELEQATNQRIKINAPHLIPLEANVWYDVKFEIDGPPTHSLDLNDLKRNATVYANTIPIPGDVGEDAHRYGVASFDFFTGSGQLPEYHFVLSA